MSTPYERGQSEAERSLRNTQEARTDLTLEQICRLYGQDWMEELANVESWGPSEQKTIQGEYFRGMLSRLD